MVTRGGREATQQRNRGGGGGGRDDDPTSSSVRHNNRVDDALDLWSGYMYNQWDHFCDYLERPSSNHNVKWFSKHVLRKLSVEAPVVVTFVFLCTVIHLLCSILPGGSLFWGVDDFFHFTNPLHYIRQITHIFVHSGWKHLQGNMTHLLLVGPSAEAVFGSTHLVYILLVVAISTAWAHIWIGKAYSRQLGASGVCFALILLNSLVSAKRGKIPVSFVLTALWWLGDELRHSFVAGWSWWAPVQPNPVSHHAHLVGGLVGAAAGYYLRAMTEQQQEQQQIETKEKSTNRSNATPDEAKLTGAGIFPNLQLFATKSKKQ